MLLGEPDASILRAGRRQRSIRCRDGSGGVVPGDVLGIGLIGAGRIGRLHATHLARQVRRARLVAIADLVESLARTCAAEVGVSSVDLDYRRLLERPEVDAVVICSSTDTHARIIAEAAAAGKQVFCEKPIALSLESIDRAL